MNALAFEEFDNEKEATYELLRVDQINVDMSYQRHISPTKIKGITARFNPNSVGVLEVSQRKDGSYVLIDGQHRHQAMKKLGIEYVECKVHHDLSQDEEAVIYVDCNKHRKQPEALDLFRAALVAKDPSAISINNIVEKCGLTIQFFPSGGPHTGGSKRRPPRTIWGVASLEEIYVRGKEQLLTDVLMLVLDSFPDDSEALQSKVILGMCKFHLQYKGRYVRQMFIQRMRTLDLNRILRHARNRMEVDGGSMVTAIAKSFQDAYDKGKQNHNRLEPK